MGRIDPPHTAMLGPAVLTLARRKNALSRGGFVSESPRDLEGFVSENALSLLVMYATEERYVSVLPIKRSSSPPSKLRVDSPMTTTLKVN